LLVLRTVVGVGFIAHGLAKLHSGPARFARLLDQIGAPFPLQTAWMVTLLELCGGLALILGAFVMLGPGMLSIDYLLARGRLWKAIHSRSSSLIWIPLW
jgi:putative oxidoreductase